MAEYWSVVYRAIADWSELRDETAKAKAALKDLGDTAKAEGDAETKAASDAAAAHRKNVTAIDAERRSMESLATSAKSAATWTTFGGRNSMAQHLSDLNQEVNSQNLLNRAQWLGFSSPQAAYSWRQTELQQAYLMNRARFGATSSGTGFTTPDQYLGYLAKERTALQSQNAAMLERAAVYRSNADAFTAYSNALRGSHGTVGTLSEGNLASAQAYEAALAGLPDQVTTKLTVDDSAFISRLAADRAMLSDLTHTYTAHDVITASYRLGGQPLSQPDIGPQTIPVRYQQVGPMPHGPAGSDVIPVSFSGPWKDQAAEVLATIAKINHEHAEVPVAFDIDPTEVAALKARLGQLDVTELVRTHLAAGSGGIGGGGGGPPPAAAAAGAEGPDPNVAAAWKNLSAAQLAAGNSAAGDVIKFKAAASALDSLSGPVQRIRGLWGFLAHDFTLFAGLFGSTALIGAVAGWHIVLDGIIEALALLIPALVTATVGLLGWGAAAAVSGQKVYNQMKNVLTVSSALNQAVPPLKGNFEDLQNAVRPQVFQLFGDALDLINGKTGVFQRLIMQTGHTLDYLGARIVVDTQQGGAGLQKFFDAGSKILSEFSQILVNLGHALMGFLRATEITHIAEDLLAVAVVLSKLFNVIAQLPPGLLAVVLGLHGLSLWGGLAVTALAKMAVQVVSLFGALGPLSGVMGTLAGKLGASDAQLVKIAGHTPAVKAVAEALGQNAASVAQFAVAADKSGKSVTELAASTAAGSAMLAKYGRGLSAAGQDAVALAVAAGGTEAQIAKVAASAERAVVNAGFFATALAKVGGLSGLATGGLAALAAAAGFFAYKSLTARDAAQQWIDSVHQGLASQPLFTVIGKNMSDLAAVTAQLAHSQGLSAQASHELTGAQAELSTNQALMLSRVGQVSKAYGVGMVGALELLHTAGVKTSDLFTRQGLVWATDLQMVKGLVGGYKAMGQQLGTVGSDLNVLLVSESDQLKSMQNLNKAWDSFQLLVAGSFSGVIKVATDLRGLATAGQAAGASMVGLSANSLTLQKDFQGTYTDVETLFSAFRSAQAVDGGAGNFTKFVKDAVSALIPLAGQNKAAAAEISQLAQEAGGPATTNLKQLALWSGNVKDPMTALYKAAQQATVASSNLSSDAAKLSNTLQADLNPAMARAAFDAEGGQKALSGFADDLLKLGPGSQVTVSAGKRVADMFLSIDKNSGQAKAQFVGWVESMGYSKDQANKLWGEVSKGAKPLADMQSGLASSATASDNLSKSGFFAQRGDAFRTNMRDMATFFTKTLPGAFVGLANGWDGLWGKSYTGFMRDVGSPVSSFLTRTLPGFFTGTIPRAWDKAWSELGSPVVRAVDAVKKVFTSSFDGWWKSHGAEVKQIWQSVVDNMTMWWDNFTGGLKHAWETFTGWFRGSGDVSKYLRSGFDSFLASLKPLLTAAEGLFRLVWLTVEAGGKAAWAVIAAAGKTAWDAMAALFKTVWAGVVAALKVAWDLGVGVLKAVWDAFVGVINVTLDLITGHWSKAWHDMQAAWNQVNGAIDQAFRQTWNAIWDFLRHGWGNFDAFFHQMWNNSINMLEQLWHAFWNWFSSTIIASFGNFFTHTIPHWFDGFVSGAKHSWDSVWGAFDRTVIGNMSHFFTSTVPRWWGDFLRGGEGAMRGVANSIQTGFKNSVNWVVDHVINSVINFVDKDILRHLPGSLHINTIPHVAAAGGDMPAPRRYAAGSVPGDSAVDGTHIMAMGGEYMVRQPARMALENTFGRGFMDSLNQADSWLGSGSRGTPASQQRRPGVNAAYAAGGLVNPIGSGLRPERVDMGVDYGGFGALYALGSGTITSTDNSGWPGGTFIDLRLNPPYGTGYWYYAEDIQPAVRVGQGVSAGQLLGHAYGGPSGIEVGWASGVGGQTAAARDGQQNKRGDPGEFPTAWGVAASNLIKSLGGPAGIISGPIHGGTGGLGGAISAVWQSVEGLLDSAGSGLGDLVKPLAKWVSGGAGELLKLARQGAASIFGSVWDHTIKPMAELIPGDTFAGALAQGSTADIRQGIVNFFKGQDSTAQSTAASSGGGGGNIGPVSGPADAGPGQAENYARGRLASFGWGADQFPPLQSLWTKESGWNRFARNPGSGAYGIPQALPPTKLPGAGQAGGGSHASPQVDWGLGYIKGTYHSPAGAWAHEVAHNWYPFGGVIGQYAAGGPVGMAAGGPFSTVPAFRAQLAAKQRGEAAKYSGLEHAYAAGPAKYRTKLTVQELGTLSRRQAAEVAAYNKLAGSGFTAAHLSHLGATARDEERTANDRQLSRPAAQGGHPRFAADLRGFLHDLSVLSGEKIPAGSVTDAHPPVPGVNMVPEWTSAVGSTTGTVGALNTAVVSVESPAFWKLAGENLSAIKGITPAQAGAWHSWRSALEKQQYKTFGLGHSPPGAFGVLEKNFNNPAKITAGQWGAFKSDVDYMVREEAGTGISGGINPPGTPANSGYVPWHYFNPQWKALRSGLLKVQQRIPAAEQVWRNIYGPNHLPATPGPGQPPPAASFTGLPDVSGVATMGGPAVPVSAPGLDVPDYGFAAGGGLGQVADMFGGLSSGSVLPVTARYGIPDSVLSQLSGSRASGESPRRLSQAAAATIGGDQVGVKVENMTVYNPAPVDVGSSIARASNRLSFLAGRGIA